MFEAIYFSSKQLRSLILPQTLKAAGDTAFTMITAVISMWVFRILTGIFFSCFLNWGVIGIWFAMLFDWSFRSLVFFIRYKGHKWESKYVS